MKTSNSENISRKNKHLTLQERIEIQEYLYACKTFTEIGELLQKHKSTISKEVKLHSKEHKNGFSTRDEKCPNLLKPPYVCNGCKQKSSSSCRYTRIVYTAKTAQQEYEETLVNSREGIPLNKAEFYESDRIISKRIEAGQHLYQIISCSDISFSLSSAYRYFHKGYFSISLIKLPRAVKFKSRNSKKDEYVPKGVKIGRTYNDFLQFMKDAGLSNHCEADTVIGTLGGKVIMTFIFTQVNFMFGILLDNKTSAEASSKILLFKKYLSENGFSFGELMPVLLTDNGGEFSDVFSFELDSHGNIETRMFFCDPMHSSQKPFVEKNHTLFRDIIPKGTSFDNFSQNTVNLIFSHVNSVNRKSLNGKSPFDMFSFIYSEELANVLGISRISPDEVIQSPILTTYKNFVDTLVF